MGETETGFETGAGRVELEADLLVLHCLHSRVRGACAVDVADGG
jgi:hypothetical protein